MNEYCAQHDVFLKDYGCDPVFFNNRHRYFNDSDHLNQDGATFMTTLLIDDILAQTRR